MSSRWIVWLLAAALVLSASGSATLCVEPDGTARVELFAALCCDGSPASSAGPGEGAGAAPAPPCAGCDDVPLDGSRWSPPRAAEGSPPPAPAAALAWSAPPAPTASWLDATSGSVPEPHRAGRTSKLRC